MGSSQSNTSALIGRTSTWVEFRDDWFAQGASRYAYRGTFHGDPHFEGKPCVVKVYKEEWYDRLSEYAWVADDRAYRKAHEMAQLFNARMPSTKPIEFVKPEFTRVSTRAAFNLLGFIPFERKVKGKLAGTSDSVSNIIPANATLAVEPYLEGKYVKFNSNSGYSERADIATPAAFSHLTYHESNGQALVCDLQGVRSSSGYKFTDPAVNSSGTQLGFYGPTDLGKFGIVKFFKNHRCNDMCRRLRKPRITNVSLSASDMSNLDRIVTSMPSQSATSYTYWLSAASGVPNADVNRVHNNLNLEPIYAQPFQATD
ncbi:alpha-protein kinase 1-like [Patiria miniata]|uniref:Alpha-type protein kinase domain-containing protein n=1 Tax=Patiria miniata TaxID=46514 RepID=A0A914AFS1_PATMI|nr:alpha-protein kinase 1-like [Patiria miniata]XP_038062816.1 alpha-protein kinase 1-like [Patiria miniata]XP_038062817.1 alpha-protein kinase 1-like [Patiria miniata]